MNRVRRRTARLAIAGVVLSGASVAACGVGAGGPVWTFRATAETVDGLALGPERVLTGDQFHRLEATARAAWRAAHPDDVLSAFEVRSAVGPVGGSASPGSGSASGAPPAGPDDYLVLVTVVGGGRHLVALHCDPSTFPAQDSCS